MKAQLVYSNNYDFALWGIDRLHPFDGSKFSKAWKIVLSAFKHGSDFQWLTANDSISDNMLKCVHTEAYLSSLQSSNTIARVIEIPFARFVPNVLLQRGLLTPVRIACSGTLMAAESALKNKNIAMNFGGGFHHAFADHGEGFCFFADAVLSILDCRKKGLLKENDKVLMIDLDAHRGNGFEALMGNDASVKIFDMYSFQVYPGLHEGDPDDFPYMIPLKAGMKDEVYLRRLEDELSLFLNEHSDAKLVYYNAGNDILDADPLGGLAVSFDGVVQRDRYVINQLVKRQLATVIMTSGGYSTQSHKLIAELAKTVIMSTKVK